MSLSGDTDISSVQELPDEPDIPEEEPEEPEGVPKPPLRSGSKVIVYRSKVIV